MSRAPQIYVDPAQVRDRIDALEQHARRELRRLLDQEERRA